MIAFLQARRTSKRFPDKIYQELNGAPVLFHAIARAKEATLVDQVVVIAPHELPDIPEGVGYFVWDEGDEGDVLGRFAAAAQEYRPDYIVRLTADCPLLDPHLIDAVVHHAVGQDYVSNVLNTLTFPDGVDVEVFPRAMIHLLDQSVNGAFDREHVTTVLRNNPTVQESFEMTSIQSFEDYSGIKISIDTEADLRRLRAMEKRLFE